MSISTDFRGQQDAFSYNFEQGGGIEGHSMVTVAMKERGLTLQGAMDFIGEEFRKFGSRFITLMKEIPSFDDLDDEAHRALGRYIWGMGNWVTANTYWSFECGRYFGTRGLEIMQHRLVEISPKREDIAPKENALASTVICQ
jgi:hypothetical protein